MNYAERFELAENGIFRKRLQMALWIAAVDVLNDGAASPDAKTWARKQLLGPADTDIMRRLAIRAVANTAIGDAGLDALDSDIQYIVNGIIEEFMS